MRVLHVVASVPGYPGSGGAEKFCFDLAQHQLQDGINVEVAAPYGGEYNGIIIHKLYKVHDKYLRKMFFDYFNPLNIFKLRGIIKKTKPDVIHFHNFYGISSYLACYSSKRIPTLITAHDYWPFCYWASLMYDYKPCNFCLGRKKKFTVNNAFHWMHTKLNQYFFRKCKFVSPSEYMNNKISEVGKFKNTEWLPYGIDCPSSITTFDKIILWVGRLTIEKGFDTVAPVLNNVKNKYPGWRVLVLGEGPQKEYLQSKYTNIDFLGYKNPHDFYKNASILVMSSIWPDNLPFSVLESMAMGLCVVSPPVGGIPEMVVDGKTGYLISEKRTLDSILNELISKPEQLKILGYEAKKSISAKFSYELCISRHQDIYSHLMKNK